MVPEGDQGGPLHHPLHPPAVDRLAHRADAVGIEHHRLAQQLGAPDDRQIVQQGPGGGGVLEQAPAPGQQGVAPGQGGQHPQHPEPGDGLQAVLLVGEGRVLGQHGDRHLIAGLPDGLLDGVQNGVVPGIFKAVVATHHHPVLLPGGPGIGGQTVLGHAAHRIAIQDDLPAIGPQLVPLLPGQGQGGAHLLQQLLLSGPGVGAAAEVGVHRLVQQLRGKQAGVALGPGEDHRLAQGHGLQGGPGDPHEQVTGGGHPVHIGAGAGEHHAGPAGGLVHRPGPGGQLLIDVAAAGDQHPGPGAPLPQGGGQLDELPGGPGGGLIQPAHMAHHRAVPQAELRPDLRPGHRRGELLRVDAVDGQGDALGGEAVLLLQIVPDVLGHRQGVLSPVGQPLEHPARLIHPVAGGDKGEPQPPAQLAAQEGGDAGVGVDHVGLLPADDLLQDTEGPEHVGQAAPVQGGLVVSDAGGGHLGDVDAAVGDDGHVVALSLQLLGQLHNVGLRPADVQSHGGHEDLHAARLLSFDARSAVTGSPSPWW